MLHLAESDVTHVPTGLLVRHDVSQPQVHRVVKVVASMHARHVRAERLQIVAINHAGVCTTRAALCVGGSLSALTRL